jgi:SagB-type dehydrogenase family enzyme
MTAADGRRFRRSPYLILRWSGQDAILLNAHNLMQCSIHSQLVAILCKLDQWCTVKDLNAAGLFLEEKEVQEIIRLGLLEAEDEVADVDCASFKWDPIELAVQRRTAFGTCWPERPGTGPRVVSARFADHASTVLPAPFAPAAMQLCDTLERRRSTRTYAARPLQLEELSTLLHYAARVVEQRGDSQLGDRVFRPFPTAGARSELEIYVVAEDVLDLEPGAHYYDPFAHRLLRIRPKDDQHGKILRSANVMAGGMLNRNPAVVMLIMAVFERVMWKYHDLSLSLIYKDVGALFQTLYLVATAFGLAPCALGAGDESENSRWLGLDPLYESQVGCFLIGPQVTREGAETMARNNMRHQE